MRIDWISRTVVKVHLSPRLTMPLMEEVMEILAVVAEVIRSTSPRTSFHHVSFVGELIMQRSNDTSALIHIIWAKIKVSMLQTHME
jgi:hypothetical protein